GLGQTVGTPLFMSPEQCEAQPLDHRSDIYSLGGTYYCLLTGRDPYQEAATLFQAMYLHVHGPIPDPQAIYPSIPDASSRVVARAMDTSREERYQSTEEMPEDLKAVRDALAGMMPIPLPSDRRAAPAPRIEGKVLMKDDLSDSRILIVDDVKANVDV